MSKRKRTSISDFFLVEKVPLYRKAVYIQKLYINRFAKYPPPSNIPMRNRENHNPRFLRWRWQLPYPSYADDRRRVGVYHTFQRQGIRRPDREVYCYETIRK